MMYEQAIVVTKKISIPGQCEYFQLSLPKNVTHLIGLEYGFSILFTPPGDFTGAFVVDPGDENFRVNWNYYLGNLTLMVPGCENIFFQEDIHMDKNIRFGETVAANIWEASAFIYGAKRHEYSFRVSKSSNLLEGFYKDAYRNDPGNFFPYLLRIYLWTEKCGI